MALTALLGFALWGAESPPRAVEMRHLYTFGSPHGIHPPRLLNRKVARAALGAPENPYGLVYPVAVATDLRHRVWITDSGTGSVHVFDGPGGGYREIRHLPDGALQRPSGIAVDRQGRMYVADAATGGIFVFDEHGEFDHALFHHGERVLEAPSAIALSEDNRTIFVADPPRNAILALNREGDVNATIALPPEFSPPSTISIIHNQIDVLATERHRIGMVSPAGVRRGELRFDEIAYPTALGFDRLRRQYFVANPRWMVVEIFNEEGQNLGAFGQSGEGPDQMQGVDYLYVDELEHLVYLVDSRHGKVLVFGEAAKTPAIQNLGSR